MEERMKEGWDGETDKRAEGRREGRTRRKNDGWKKGGRKGPWKNEWSAGSKGVRKDGMTDRQKKERRKRWRGL